MKKVSLLLLLLVPLRVLAKQHAEDPSEQRRQRKGQHLRKAKDLLPVVWSSTLESKSSSGKGSKPRPTMAPTIAQFIDKDRELTILFEAIKRVSGRSVDLRIIFPDRYPEEPNGPSPAPPSPPPPAPTPPSPPFPTPRSPPAPAPTQPSLLECLRRNLDFPCPPPEQYSSPYTPPEQYSSPFKPPAQYSSPYTPPEQYSSPYTPPEQYSSPFKPPAQYSSPYTPPDQYTSRYTPPSSIGALSGGLVGGAVGGFNSGLVGDVTGGLGGRQIPGTRNLLFMQDNPLRRANLLQILDEPGDFTFFAPTNNAFLLIPERVLELLFLQDEFIPHLEDLLLYHGLNGKRLVADFFAVEIIKTFNDEGVLFRRQPPNSLENLRVNQNNVRRRNINASNGVTHVIDGVLAPDWVSNSILAKVAIANDLSILFELIELAELTETLDILGEELTLVAPTNNAFNALGNATLQALRSPENLQSLTTLLAYHVILGVITTDELDELDGGSLTTAQGGVVAVSVGAELGGTTRKINQATVLSDDSILVNNGVFYKIDAVLNPNSFNGF